MKLNTFIPALLAATTAAVLVHQASQAGAFVIAAPGLPLTQRHFKVFNNFSDPTANDNQIADPHLPGYTGATLAIWKGVAEWGSRLHGVGGGDPHQPGDLGSGGANFDSIFQGEATSVGSTNDNTFSEIAGSSGGVLAFIETPANDGWRIRYYSAWTWQDGPGTNMGANEFDLQGLACRLYGNALGLGNSSVAGATMATTVNNLVDLRSIELDDQAGVQAIYGVASANKPIVSGYSINGNQIQINGANFAPTGNSVWFTPSGSGGPSMLTNVGSSGNSITVPIPLGAGSGDVLVQAPGSAYDRLSNAWPLDLSGSANCPAPQIFCTSLPNSSGLTSSISTTGTAGLFSSNDLVLTAIDAPASKPGLFFFGPQQVAIPFGDGVRCVGGSLSRLGVLITSANGSASQTIDLHVAPYQGGGFNTSVGDALNFQFWFRDPTAGASGFNTSNGLQIEVCP